MSHRKLGARATVTSLARKSRFNPGRARRLSIAAALVGLALSETAASAQMMLYEGAPAGFAFVRFANALSGDTVVNAEGVAEPLTLTAAGPGRISAYYGVEDVTDRAFSVELSDKSHARFTLTPGVYQTVLLQRSAAGLAASIVIDHTELSQNKARLAFYNATSDCPGATLRIDPDGPAIFSNIGPNFMRGRSVNPVTTANVVASCGADQRVALNLGPLNAGGQYSVWLMAPEGAPIAFVSKNIIAPYSR